MEVVKIQNLNFSLRRCFLQILVMGLEIRYASFQSFYSLIYCSLPWIRWMLLSLHNFKIVIFCFREIKLLLFLSFFHWKFYIQGASYLVLENLKTLVSLNMGAVLHNVTLGKGINYRVASIVSR